MPEITSGCRKAAEEIADRVHVSWQPNDYPSRNEIALIIARHTRDGELIALLRGAVALVDSEWLKAMVSLSAAHGLHYSGPILFEVEAARALLAALDAEEKRKNG